MSDQPPLLRIGTRGSPLALAQATEVRRLLGEAHPALAEPFAVTITVIRTTGDIITDRTLAAIGGKGLFTKEIEQALLDDQIDIAVHSMKDVPTWLPDALIIDCFLPREDPRDAFFSRNGALLSELPPGSVVGSASLRRQALLLLARPELKVVPFRGNVDTRLRKLDEGIVDATLLAIAGLNRLGHRRAPTEILSPDLMLPAVAQGVIGIERRQADDRTGSLLALLNDAETERRVAAERALLGTLDGSCRTPIAALAVVQSGRLRLDGLVIRPDGSQHHSTWREGSLADAERLGADAGAELRDLAGPGFFSLPEVSEVAR